MFVFFFFFTDTATTEIYTLSLHDALPIFECVLEDLRGTTPTNDEGFLDHAYLPSFQHTNRKRGYARTLDRKSTRLNSSHSQISYAVFCLKKKKKQKTNIHEFRKNKDRSSG